MKFRFSPFALVLGAFCVMLGSSAMALDLSIEDMTGAVSLSGPSVREAHVAPDGEHIAFLKGSADNRFLLDIWVIGKGGGASRRLTDAVRLQPEEVLSDAEKARRERERTAEFHGILSYTWAKDGQSLLFSLGGDLYLQSLDPAHPVAERLIHAHSPDDAVLDAEVSPKGHYVSFLRRGNLFVMDLRSRHIRQISHEMGGDVRAGEAEFIAQEEFEERHGYWWSPDDSALLYKVVDERPVARVRRMEVYADRTEIVEQRYPAAGAANAQVSLKVALLAGGTPRSVPESTVPESYLVDPQWRPDGRGFFFRRINRAQNRLALVAVSWPTLHGKVVIEDVSRTWIDVTDQFRPLKDGGFIWGSARSGFQHLYRYGADGQLAGALTDGAWTVDSLLAVDEHAGDLFFAGNRDGVSTRQLYAVSLQPGSPIRRLTHDDGWHDAEFAEQGPPYVDRWSDPSTPTKAAVFDGHGTRLAWLEENRLDEHHPYWPHLARHAQWTYGTLDRAGQLPLDYALLKPSDFVAGQRYPAIVLVYGGPTVQTIQKRWDDSLFAQFLAQQGYLVFQLDNRGSSRRGRAFADPIFRQLGKVEVEDQAAGLDWLRAQDFVDAGHIGVFGWSYGGYMSLLMQSRLADRLAAGVVVAPVTDWANYDTAYTERYMGTPQENPDGYAQSAVFASLEGLSHPLLLIHGMADDNVLFANSTRLMSVLQKINRPFALMTYPGAKHGIDAPEQRRHLYTGVRDFFAQQLHSGTSRALAGN